MSGWLKTNGSHRGSAPFGTCSCECSSADIDMVLILMSRNVDNPTRSRFWMLMWVILGQGDSGLWLTCMVTSDEDNPTHQATTHFVARHHILLLFSAAWLYTLGRQQQTLLLRDIRWKGYVGLDMVDSLDLLFLCPGKVFPYQGFPSLSPKWGGLVVSTYSLCPGKVFLFRVPSLSPKWEGLVVYNHLVGCLGSDRMLRGWAALVHVLGLDRLYCSCIGLAMKNNVISDFALCTT